MKKIYNNPTLKVVKIQPARILAGSDPIPVDPTKSTESQWGRRSRFSKWEDDFDFEE